LNIPIHFHPPPLVAAGEAYVASDRVEARVKYLSWTAVRSWSEGKCDEGRDLLAPVNCRFTAGFDTLDLKWAKTLLDALAS
jgi:hypothetical protein